MQGRLVAVQGSIRVDRYVSDDGNNRTFTKVSCRNIQSLEVAKKSEGQAQEFDSPKFEPSDANSYGLNYQKTGKELMSQVEITVMDGSKFIFQLRGVRPFLSDKFDITKAQEL